MVTVDVRVTGAEGVEAWLATAPGKLLQAVWQTTEYNIEEIIKPAVVEATPRRSGTLAGSIHGSVTRTGTGARGSVSSGLRYASFVERGTTKHGPARHMFQHGYESTLERVEQSYEGMAVKFAETAR
jgi:hypothetical protein